VVSDPNCVSQGGAYQGDDVPCDPNLCTIPTGACCFDNGTCQELTAVDCGTAGGVYQGDGAACEEDLCPIILEPFVDALPIPALATPTSGTVGGVATYDIEIVEVQQQLHRDLPPTTVWGYDGTYPGPTILASTGNPITVNWINDLRDPNGNLRTDHYLDVDLCPHGAQDLPKVVTHLHGGHVPAEVDGYPEHTFLPGEMETYVYPNNQQAATVWYHDHALGITRLNVIMGLAGFYVITDAVEQALNLPTGEFDLGMAIQDRSFHSDGSWDYPATVQDHFFGDKMLVNGKVWPFHNVKQGKYRLRMLNGCTSRALTLAFDNGMSFQQIAAEGGLFEAPATVSQVTIGNGERAEVIVDFAPYAPGTEIILTNSAVAPFPSGDPNSAIPNVMKFIVQGQAGDTDPVPATLRTVEVLDPNDAIESRDFHLQKFSEGCAGSEWLINGLHWDDITEYPVLGTTEVWNFVNRSGISHPMHMHMVFFQVLERQDFTIVDGNVVPVGPPIPPTASEAGWKDTAMVHPNQITRVIARFEDYQGKYAYHCHILEHEDHEMMRQFQTIFPGDVNGDCLVNITDVGIVLANFGATGATREQGDLNGDGVINITDLGIVLANFGSSCP
jgi:spore coat protein A